LKLTKLSIFINFHELIICSLYKELERVFAFNLVNITALFLIHDITFLKHDLIFVFKFCCNDGTKTSDNE